jgi:hypothetical protein
MEVFSSSNIKDQMKTEASELRMSFTRRGSKKVINSFRTWSLFSFPFFLSFTNTPLLDNHFQLKDFFIPILFTAWHCCVSVEEIKWRVESIFLNNNSLWEKTVVGVESEAFYLLLRKQRRYLIDESDSAL